MTTLPAAVNPGDLITADLINQVLTGLRELDRRVGDLEQAPSAEQPALGFIRLRTLRASASVLNVNDSTTTHSFSFELLNNTDRALTISLVAEVRGLTGTWAPVLNVGTRVGVREAVVSPGQTISVDLRLTVPGNAVTSETGSVVLSANVGAPHFKDSEARFENIETGTSSGPPRVRDLTVTDPTPNDFTFTDTTARPFNITAVYGGQAATSPEIFLITATIAAQSTAPGEAWTLQFRSGLFPPTSALPPGFVGGVRPLNPASTTPTSVVLHVSPPAAVPAFGAQTATVSLTVESTSTAVQPRLTRTVQLRLRVA